MNLKIRVVAPNGASVATHFPRDTDVQQVRDWASFEFIKQGHLNTDKVFLVFSERRVPDEHSVENYGNAAEEICFNLRTEAIPSGG